MKAQVQCSDCKEQFWVKGATDSDDAEQFVVVHDDETFVECCEHLQHGGDYEIVDSESDSQED